MVKNTEHNQKGLSEKTKNSIALTSQDLEKNLKGARKTFNPWHGPLF